MRQGSEGGGAVGTRGLSRTGFISGDMEGEVYAHGARELEAHYPWVDDSLDGEGAEDKIRSNTTLLIPK